MEADHWNVLSSWIKAAPATPLTTKRTVFVNYYINHEINSEQSYSRNVVMIYLEMFMFTKLVMLLLYIFLLSLLTNMHKYVTFFFIYISWERKVHRLRMVKGYEKRKKLDTPNVLFNYVLLCLISPPHLYLLMPVPLFKYTS